MTPTASETAFETLTNIGYDLTVLMRGVFSDDFVHDSLVGVWAGECWDVILTIARQFVYDGLTASPEAIALMRQAHDLVQSWDYEDASIQDELHQLEKDIATVTPKVVA
ncbi:MAG: hypothetical protein LBM66_00950 [Bifidobacteriaceae bacterium]|jgi:hypothetical protein|nr:hypothetical protein [Bifidobacteriaceae bacterium]